MRLMEKQFPVKAVSRAVFFRAVKPVEKLTPDVGSEVHLSLLALLRVKKNPKTYKFRLRQPFSNLLKFENGP